MELTEKTKKNEAPVAQTATDEEEPQNKDVANFDRDMYPLFNYQGRMNDDIDEEPIIYEERGQLVLIANHLLDSSIGPIPMD